MDDLNKTTAAGTFIKLGGESYRVRPLSLRSIAAYRQWVGQEVAKLPSSFRSLRGELEGLPPEIQKHLAVHAYETSRNRDHLTSPEAETVMNSADGMAQLLWLGIRQDHPDVSIDQVKEAVLNSTPTETRDILVAVNEINGWTSEGNSLRPIGQEPPIGRKSLDS